MTDFNRKSLMATVATAAFTLTLATSPALAFDDVDWEWNKTVTENVVKDVNITIDANPSGMVEIEKIQAQIGDVNATSHVSGVHNNVAGLGEDGTVTFDETITVTSNFDKPIGVGNSVNNTGGSVNDDGDTPITSTLLTGTLSEQANGYTVINDVQLQGELALEDIEGINNAVDLPEVVSTATAVGNNQSINSSVSVDLHDGQFLIGGFNPENTPEEVADILNNTPESGNTHTEVAGALLLSAALGVITPASVNANSTVDDILNASVDSTATAVGNNLSVNVAANTPDDAMVMADLTQFAYADVNANSRVTNVSVDNYTGFGDAGMGPLGDPQKPLVSSVATAVGNNASITVSSTPAIVVP